MEIIYVNKFVPKKDLPFMIEEGRVYPAKVFSDELIQVKNGEDEIILEGATTNSDKCYAEIDILTEENWNQYPLHPEDRSKVISHFEIPTIEQEIKSSIDEIFKDVDEAIDAIEELAEHDPRLVRTIGQLAKYMVSTYSDKYEASMLPDVDLTGLLHNPESEHATGFLIGNALKYQKRYLTKGFEKSRNPQDLFKAIHYMIMELDRKNNG